MNDIIERVFRTEGGVTVEICLHKKGYIWTRSDHWIVLYRIRRAVPFSLYMILSYKHHGVLESDPMMDTEMVKEAHRKCLVQYLVRQPRVKLDGWIGRTESHYVPDRVELRDQKKKEKAIVVMFQNWRLVYLFGPDDIPIFDSPGVERVSEGDHRLAPRKARISGVEVKSLERLTDAHNESAKHWAQVFFEKSLSQHPQHARSAIGVRSHAMSK